MSRAVLRKRKRLLKQQVNELDLQDLASKEQPLDGTKKFRVDNGGGGVRGKQKELAGRHLSPLSFIHGDDFENEGLKLFSRKVSTIY